MSVKSTRTNHSKKRAMILGLSVSAVLIASFVAIYASGHFFIPFSQPNRAAIQQGTTDFTYEAYPYLGKLASDSDIIIVGKVVAFKGNYTNPRTFLTYWYYDVSVEQSAKGDVQKDKVVNVAQVDSPSYLMKADERFLLFLKYDPTFKVYFSLGGPQGRYQVTDDHVNSMDVIDPSDSFIKVKAKDKPLGEFLLEIKEAVKDPDATKPPVEEEIPEVLEIPVQNPLSNGTEVDRGIQ